MGVPILSVDGWELSGEVVSLQVFPLEEGKFWPAVIWLKFSSGVEMKFKTHELEFFDPKKKFGVLKLNDGCIGGVLKLNDEREG